MSKEKICSLKSQDPNVSDINPFGGLPCVGKNEDCQKLGCRRLRSIRHLANSNVAIFVDEYIDTFKPQDKK